MTGILENMRAELTAANETIAALVAAVRELKAGGGAAAVAAPVVAADPFAGLGVTTAAVVTAAPANVTSEQIVGLITPYVENEAFKTALGAEMRAMGINALPEAQPHQYGELYQRFQGVITRMQASGATAAAASSGSII